MNLRLSMAMRNAIVSTYANLIDAGGEPGTVSLYTGPKPGTADSTGLTRGQTLLAQLSFALPCAKQAADGSIEFAPSEQAQASANYRNGARNNLLGALPDWILETDSSLESGKAEWARVQDSNGNVIFDCDVSNSDGDGMMKINSIDIIKGGPLRLSNFIITAGIGVG